MKSVKKVKFSKEQKDLLTSSQRKSIDLGIFLHEKLEKIDIKNLTEKEYLTALIKESDDKLFNSILINLSSQSFIHDVKNFWTEYEFFYQNDSEQTIGIIDLLVEGQNDVYIIDYKLANIKDGAYIEQLKGYKRVISEYFSKNIKCYLYSLINNEIEEVDV